MKLLFQAFRDADIRNKILFTLLMLVLYRIGNFIPVPGVNRTILDSLSNNMLGMMNLFSGGALHQFSIFAVGIMPYITASIIIQLLQADVLPKLTEWTNQGAAGEKKRKKLTRYLTVILALFQSTAISLGFNKLFPGLVPDPSFKTYAIIVIVLTLGTIVLMGMGELITKKGIGNGVSLIIFAGIVATMPTGIQQYYLTEFTEVKNGYFLPILKTAIILIVVILIMMLVIFIQQSSRKIPVNYAVPNADKSGMQTQKSFLPLKVNSANVVPVIFAVSLFMFPTTIVNFMEVSDTTTWIKNVLDYTHPIGMTLYALLIIAFAFFYAFIAVDPKKMAENLKNQRGNIPGVRPGIETEQYLTKVLMRLTVVGSIFLALISIAPILISFVADLPQQVRIGGVSLLIMTSVVIETVSQINVSKMKKSYRGFLRKKR